MNDLERLLGRVLHGGVILSTVALVTGLGMTFAGANAALTSAILGFGVLVLIGTPVARVVVSTIAYARDRDWTFAVLTLIVLGELIASILAAIRR